MNNGVDGGLGIATIFKLIDFPKTEGPPPYRANVVKKFSADEFHQALRFFSHLGLQPETQELKRTIHLDKSQSPWVIYLIEEELEREPSKNRSQATRERRS